MDSATKANRADIIGRFSPYYNGTSSQELAKRRHSEIRVLIQTHEAFEGLNLQDASRMINDLTPNGSGSPPHAGASAVLTCE